MINICIKSIRDLEMHNWITVPLKLFAYECVGWVELNSSVFGYFRWPDTCMGGLIRRIDDRIWHYGNWGNKRGRAVVRWGTLGGDNSLPCGVKRRVAASLQRLILSFLRTDNLFVLWSQFNTFLALESCMYNVCERIIVLCRVNCSRREWVDRWPSARFWPEPASKLLLACGLMILVCSSLKWPGKSRPSSRLQSSKRPS